VYKHLTDYGGNPADLITSLLSVSCVICLLDDILSWMIYNPTGQCTCTWRSRSSTMLIFAMWNQLFLYALWSIKI